MKVQLALKVDQGYLRRPATEHRPGCHLDHRFQPSRSLAAEEPIEIVNDRRLHLGVFVIGRSV